MAKKVRCKCSQTQLTFAVLHIVTGWATFRATFGLKKIKKVRIAWQNESWTKVIIAKDWEKVKGQVVKQPSLEKNREFLHCLVIEIGGQQGG